MIDLGRGKDLTGMTFNRLTAREPVGRTKNGTIKWRCDCFCGGETVVSAAQLRGGYTQSCGCARVEFAKRGTHHMTKSREYITWKGMWARCTNPKSPDYRWYGAVGVKVCVEWESFEKFLADMGPRPPGKTLDRYPNRAGNYERSNCRWATDLEQANNRKPRTVVKKGGVATIEEGVS